MSDSLQKLELENKARLLFFKHRGDVSKVVEDLKAEYENEVSNVGERITVDFVKKVIDKFKKQQKINDPYVATWILEYVFMGTKQREVLWDIDDQQLEEYKFFYRSACCDGATESRTNDKGEECFVCLKCEKICNVYRIPNLDVFELRRKIRTEKRNDEKQLVTAIDSLGFGSEKPPIFKQNNYQLIVGDKEASRKRVKSLTREDQQMIQDVKQLAPIDREIVISRIRQKLEEF